MAASIFHAPRSGFKGIDFAQVVNYSVEKIAKVANHIFDVIETWPILSVVSLSGGALVGAVIGVVGGPVGIAIGAIAGAAVAETIMLSAFYSQFGDSVPQTCEHTVLSEYEVFDIWERAPFEIWERVAIRGMTQPPKTISLTNGKVIAN